MKVVCGNCKSADVIRKGFRYNHSGKKQKFYCHDCGGWFVIDDGFKKMRHTPEDIVRAVHQYNDGMSLFKVQYHLWKHDGVKVTMRTISQWDKKYSLFLKSATSKCKSKA